ncbi:uncharacterized protein [Miscanthus floridulus]|uniref:uncharacterized protein n=1 Tax=Miscanthus floridulus TaxID=154761 RepID=UPI00345908B1
MARAAREQRGRPERPGDLPVGVGQGRWGQLALTPPPGAIVARATVTRTGLPAPATAAAPTPARASRAARPPRRAARPPRPAPPAPRAPAHAACRAHRAARLPAPAYAEPAPRRARPSRCCSSGRARAAASAPSPEPAPCRRALALLAIGWLKRRAATPSTIVVAFVSTAGLGLAPALPTSTAVLASPPPPAAVEPVSQRGAPATPRPPRATSVVGRATTVLDIRLDLRPSSVDPERGCHVVYAVRLVVVVAGQTRRMTCMILPQEEEP